MTEKQLRENVVSIAKGWLGCKESNGSHKKIIDLYNAHKPLARGYKVKYTDAWCATYGSAVAIKAGLTDIIPTECGCEEQIKLFKKIGRWRENENYTPEVGDYIYYDWQDTGAGDNKGYSDHVGIVVSVINGIMIIIEGNIKDAVGYREIKVNAKCIRGFGLPDYASKATKEEPQKVEISIPALSISLPDLVKGDKGDYVKLLQRLLISHGYKVTVNGFFDTATELAVKKFQKDKEIPIKYAGTVGAKTWAFLVY